MNTIHNDSDLKKAIQQLESKKKLEEVLLKDHFHDTIESFKPANILKNTVSEVAASPTFKHNLLNVALGLGAGYLSKKIVVGRNSGILVRTLGTALQFGVTSLLAKNKQNDEIESHKKGGLLHRIFSGNKP